jgi:hypothetical protein
MIFFFFSVEKIITPGISVPPVSHLTSCTPTKSNFYIVNCLATVVIEPDLFTLLTFHVSNLMTPFYGFSRPKGSVHAQVSFLIQTSYRRRVVSTTPKAQAIGPLFVSFPRLHF